MKISIHPRIAEIPAVQWNNLIRDNNPFLRHEFLQALETHQCVGENFGWQPCHVGIYEQQRLIAALPLYQKSNSYGEFVFDNNWADGWARAQLPYYPKLVSAIPYTPAGGQRLLTTAGREEELYALLFQTAIMLTKRLQASGFHCLFPVAEEQQWLSQQQLLVRHDCQFHWHNQNYHHFDDFLAQLKRKKRKNIQQERRRVQQAGVNIRCLDGHTATAQDWTDFNRFYQKTFDEKWGTATLNQGFFAEVARTLPDQVFLVLADVDQQCLAGSLMFRSDRGLYGRYWGCDENIDALHFECCYYQGIEYAIQQKLQFFEPGAQGEHKISRGFLPTLTQSSHWMADNPFQESLQMYVQHEQDAIADYMQTLEKRSPYQSEPS